MKKDSIEFNDAVDLILQHNPNVNREALIEDMIEATLTGELKLNDDTQLDDFYFYCKQHLDKDNNSSSPLNWINMFLHSSMLKELKSENLPGLHPIVKALRNNKCGQSFNFIIHPHFLKKEWKESLIKNKDKYVKMNGILRFKNNEFYFDVPKIQKILLKFCWVVE